MTFVPLLPPVEPPSLPVPIHSEVLVSLPQQQQQQQSPSPPEPASLESVLPVEEALASLTLHHEMHSESEAEDSDSASGPHHRHRHRRPMTMPLYPSPSSSATPSLSSASDTDDMDTESEAPSVVGGSSVPSSPSERDITHEYFVATAASGSAISGGEINPYFPVLPPGDDAAQYHHSPLTPRQNQILDACKIARPGQTPPLSSACSGAPVLIRKSESSDVTDVLLRKIKLEAIPSPSLLPPSPFSLYPPSPETERNCNNDDKGKDISEMTPAPVSGAKPFSSAKRTFFARSSSKLALASVPPADFVTYGQGDGGNGSPGLGLLGPSFSRRKDQPEEAGENDVGVQP